jgi:hypothetical protein
VSEARNNGVDDEARAGSKIPGSKWSADPYQGMRRVFSAFERGGDGLREQPAKPQQSTKTPTSRRRRLLDGFTAVSGTKLGGEADVARQIVRCKHLLLAHPSSPKKETAPVQSAVHDRHGADGRTRTGDMTLTKRLLYQLSYIGTRKKRIRAAVIVFESIRPRQSSFEISTPQWCGRFVLPYAGQAQSVCVEAVSRDDFR